MQKFRYALSVPPGGVYFYTVPETGTFVERRDWGSLEDAVREHYAVNRLPVPEGLRASIEDAMCNQLPKGFCQPESEHKGALVLTIFTVKQATQERVPNGPVASQAVAEWRASVCALCPQNRIGVCPTCTGLLAWARSLSGYRTTLQDTRLGLCLATKTLLWALVHGAPAPKAGEVFPDVCWIPGGRSL